MLVASALVATQSACGSSKRSGPAVSRKSASRAIATEPPLTQRIEVEPAASRQIVARVGRHAITRAYLERWTEIETVFASKYQRSSSVPAGFVPDPPTYKLCIAYLAATSTGAPVAPSDAAQLKRQCEHERETQELSTLGHLLLDSFSYEEAATKGVSVTAAEIRAAAATRGVKQSVLAALGVPAAYQQFQLGAELLTRKLFKTLPVYRRVVKAGRGHETLKMADEVDNESTSFYREMVQRWTERTYCEPEFVVAECSDYAHESPL